jgi:magnesium-protoporphyrin O-methyltransferase
MSSPVLHDNCCGVASLFDAKLARRDLAAYRRRGPSASTRVLLASLRAANPPATSLLDIGGGVGTIAHELLDSGAQRATVVDASPSYLAAAGEEVERRGTGTRLQLRMGDVVDIADDLQSADVVTLDKVVCCYRDLESLLAVAASRAQRLCGLVYPRDNWWVRLPIAVENVVRRWRGTEFQGYIHANAEIDGTLRREGLELRTKSRGVWWVVAVYERRPAANS